MQSRLTMCGVVLALVVWSASGGPATAEAQRRLPLQPYPDSGQPVSPFVEGWYDNGDGTYTISYGYWNRNREEIIEIPLGEDNVIEPSRFDGPQPTTFLPGRHRGVFAVTISEDERDEDVWWMIRNANEEVHKVPGRALSENYQLDWFPRPHGTIPPMVWFESEENAGKGPLGVTAQETQAGPVGSPLAIAVNVRDDSERNPEDPCCLKPIPVRVIWSKYKGPGAVDFTRHESTPEPEPAAEETGDGASGPGPETVVLEEGAGTASVNATFGAPGDYVLMAQADNWGSPDSSSADQCCWSNAYVRVTVR